jgi:signal transduction histidine kinase
MDHTRLALRLHESGSPAAAFDALVESVRAAAALEAAAWTDARGAVRFAWPEGAVPPPDAPPDASRAVLALPLAGDAGTLVLAGADPLDDAAAWAPVAAALEAVSTAARARTLLEEERDQLLQRAEESEALHVLGLAANRTLDPEEVLDLVARFSRTLLGAHYVTVTTVEDGIVRARAAVGLRAQGKGPDDDPLASRIVREENLVVLGETEGPGADAYPFHAAEGMIAGLGVPLALFGSTFGALVVGYRRPYTPAPQDTRLALTLAGHAAVAISNARLHRALADRSTELAHAYEELRESSLSKERFFAAMSHEIRTPLNGILGYQSLLMDGMAGELPPQAHAFVQKTHRAARNLLRIVDDVLDYAKLEAGRMDLDVQPLSPGQVVDDAVAVVAPMATDRDLRLTGDCSRSVGLLHADPARLQQILINLLSNALKFTPPGGEVALSAAVREGEDGKRQIVFRVRDTGPGIAAADQQRIFGEFEQVKGTRGGTGLGLPISRRLARLMGGDLTVESTPGAGATFTLLLPAAGPGNGTEAAS